MQVYGGHICGAKKQSTTFVPTGQARGHYPIYVCDKQPHARGEHKDSHANESWR
jgi:hypothetical protein